MNEYELRKEIRKIVGHTLRDPMTGLTDDEREMTLPGVVADRIVKYLLSHGVEFKEAEAWTL